MDRADELHEPGSPSTLEAFHNWCRDLVAAAVAERQRPDILIGDSRERDEPIVAYWDVRGEPPSLTEFLDRTVPSWARETASSQVSIAVATDEDDGPAVFLVSADETGLVAATAVATVRDGDALLLPWRDFFGGILPWHRWQPDLARLAGYRDFAKWRCETCRSVCPGEAAVTPSPCDFCGGDEVVRVDKLTPLAPPHPPYDGDERLRAA